jgi:Na+/H+ antiporter NhaD/arsenite permease-like protein
MEALPLVIFCLTVFAVLVLVIVEPSIPLPRRCFGDKTLAISYGWVPILGVIILLIAGDCSSQALKLGFVGDDKVEPYAIIILFMSQAYMCISLDHTGLFSYVASRVTKIAGMVAIPQILGFHSPAPLDCGHCRTNSKTAEPDGL